MSGKESKRHLFPNGIRPAHLVLIPAGTMLLLLAAHALVDAYLPMPPWIHDSPLYRGGRILLVSGVMSVVLAWLIVRYTGQYDERVRKKSDALDEVRQFLTQVIATSAEAILTFDENEVITSWNGSAEAIYGWTAEEMIGGGVDKLLPEDEGVREELSRLVEQVRSGAVVRHHESRRLRKNGEELVVHITSSPLVDPDGRYIGRTSFVHDATRFVELQARLVEQERLAALGQMAAAVAHELKNPLAGIRGGCEVLIADYEPGDERRDLGEEMIRQVARLNKSVQDLLTFARPQAKKPVPTDIHLIADRVLGLMKEDPSSRGVEIVRAYRRDLPLLNVDPLQIEQVLFNVFLNAFQVLKPGGHLTVTTEMNQAHAVVRVRDDGPGVAEEVARKVFEPFFTTRSRGTGLGLSIVNSIVQAHDGRVELRSPVEGDHGTEVVITLPVEG